MPTRRQEALSLADDLLADIELSRITPISIIRKASRLARLMDDSETMQWLTYEVNGYPSVGNGKGLSKKEWDAAKRSGRLHFVTKDGSISEKAQVASIALLQSQVETAKIRLQRGNSSSVYERAGLHQQSIDAQDVIDKVVGAVYLYGTQIHQELRFGAAVETAFARLRDRVDSTITNLVPKAMPMLTTALENAQSDNPEQWRNAAQACRDLIKACADELRPPGEDKNDRKMGDAQYINRMVDWIESHSISKTRQNLMKSDLEHLGARLDASANSGHKGAHAGVTKEDASRFIVGTYLLLGDILELAK